MPSWLSSPSLRSLGTWKLDPSPSLLHFLTSYLAIPAASTLRPHSTFYSPYPSLCSVAGNSSPHTLGIPCACLERRRDSSLYPSLSPLTFGLPCVAVCLSVCRAHLVPTLRLPACPFIIGMNNQSYSTDSERSHARGLFTAAIGSTHPAYQRAESPPSSLLLFHHYPLDWSLLRLFFLHPPKRTWYSR